MVATSQKGPTGLSPENWRPIQRDEEFSPLKETLISLKQERSGEL